jgi:hypothetical protein
MRLYGAAKGRASRPPAEMMRPEDKFWQATLIAPNLRQDLCRPEPVINQPGVRLAIFLDAWARIGHSRVDTDY